MKSAKAIEILEVNINQRNKQMPPDVLDALKLGLEALKSHLRALGGFAHPEQFLLPGETPPDDPE